MSTIEEVAKLAGVSPATVSRVLNKNYTVSDKRTKRVLDAIEELHYKPNMAGRMLRTSDSRTILVAFSILQPEFMNAVIETANELGYDVIFSYCLPHLKNTLSLKPLDWGLVNGVILQNVVLEKKVFAEICKKFPVVICGDMMSYNQMNCRSISVNNENVICKMVKHILSKGRKRIAYVGAKTDYGFIPEFSEKREAGVRKALNEAGISFDPNMKFIGSLGYNGGEEAADFFLAQETVPDAIVCCIDKVAIGCIQRLKQAGLRVPEDIMVTGFDGLGITARYDPTISTVSQPFYEMGVAAVRQILSKKDDGTSAQTIPAKLVYRKSTDD